jgi:hypothetical protein
MTRQSILLTGLNERKVKHYYHYILKVMEKDKVKRELNTQDGYSVNELLVVMNNLNQPDNQSN